MKLVDKGVRVKVTDFERVELDVAQALKAIYQANPDALMFGTACLPPERKGRSWFLISSSFSSFLTRRPRTRFCIEMRMGGI